MTEPIEQLMTTARSVRMTDAERASLRRTLEAYTATYRPPVSVWTFVARHAFASSLAVLVLLAGGTTTIAQRAGPDDALYSVRVAVNDRIEVLVAGDDDAKLDAELRQMERMLDDEEYALDAEIAQLAEGIDEDQQREDSGDRLDGRTTQGIPASSQNPGTAPVRFDDGADTELNGIMRDLESAARETPDMGE